LVDALCDIAIAREEAKGTLQSAEEFREVRRGLFR
jgi:hypothetical protein